MAQATGTSSSSSKWQDLLKAHCQERRMGPPQWQIMSDRRGGRTAWSSVVTVNGHRAQARFWYDGSYVNNAREDAAEVLLRRLGVNSVPQDSAGTQAGNATTATATTAGGDEVGSHGWYGAIGTPARG